MARAGKLVLFILLFAFLSVGLSLAQSEDDQGEGESEEVQPPPTQGPAEGAYSYRELKAIEERLELIKERLVQYRSRLLGLKDQLALTKMAVINASVKYRDDVGGTFDLVEVHFYLDGFEIYRGSGEDVRKDEGVEIYQGSLLPGEHLLSAELLYRGKGHGVFAYMKKNVYRVRSRYAFDVEEGEEVLLDVVSLDKGGLMGSIADRLKVEYTISKGTTSPEEELGEEAQSGDKGDKKKGKKKDKKR